MYVNANLTISMSVIFIVFERYIRESYVIILYYNVLLNPLVSDTLPPYSSLVELYVFKETAVQMNIS